MAAMEEQRLLKVVVRGSPSGERTSRSSSPSSLLRAAQGGFSWSVPAAFVAGALFALMLALLSGSMQWSRGERAPGAPQPGVGGA